MVAGVGGGELNTGERSFSCSGANLGLLFFQVLRAQPAESLVTYYYVVGSGPLGSQGGSRGGSNTESLGLRCNYLPQ